MGKPEFEDVSSSEGELSGAESEEHGAAAAEDWDDWEEEEVVPTKCLLCPTEFPSSDQALAHCASAHGFDLVQHRSALGLDVYGTIKLINYVRQSVHTMGGSADTFTLPANVAQLISDETYLRPVLADDPLLQHYFDDEDWSADEADAPVSVPAPAAQHNDSDAAAVLRAELEARNRELEQLRQQFEQFRAQANVLILGQDDASSEAAGSAPAPADDTHYIKSYSHYGIHEEMLRDTVRTLAYQDSMYKNRELFEGKVVLDVGCGTGILSMMAARAGARKVFGIDFSSVAEQAKANVAENGLSDVVTIIQGKVEDVQLPVDTVDIIISEWMGYFLIYEAMYTSVLLARDRWLAPDGLVFPDQATMLLAALEGTPALDFWDDVYGFKMTAMKKLVHEELGIEVVDAARVMSTTALIHTMDMQTLRVADVTFSSPFHLLFTRSATVGALVSYFDILFEHKCATSIHFSTGPAVTPTHWKQTVLYLRESLQVEQGESLSGEIRCRPGVQNPRAVEIDLLYSLLDASGRVKVGPISMHFLLD